MQSSSPLGKYCYKKITQGITNSPDVLQHNMNYLFCGFQFIHAYIDNLLVLTKRYWTDHVHKSELTPLKLKGKVLKCNIENYFFRQTEMKYFGFWETRYGVKPIDKKLKQ